jgi:hypothetical protein
MVATFFQPCECSCFLCLSTKLLRDFSILDQKISSAFEDMGVGPFSRAMTMTRDGFIYFSDI